MSRAKEGQTVSGLSVSNNLLPARLCLHTDYIKQTSRLESHHQPLAQLTLRSRHRMLLVSVG